MKLLINSLRRFEHNPKSRTSPAALRKLKASIKKVGQVVPIVVLNKRDILDGEGRYKAKKDLGHKYIEAVNIKIPKGVKKEEIYREVNVTPRKFSGKNKLELYQSGCKDFFAISEWEDFKTLDDLGLLNKLKGISPENLCKTAKNICSYLETNTKTNYNKVLRYLANCGDIMFVKSSFKKIPKDRLQRKINRNEKLSVG